MGRRVRVACRLDPERPADRLVIRAYLSIPAGLRAAAVRRCLDALPDILLAMVEAKVCAEPAAHAVDAALDALSQAPARGRRRQEPTRPAPAASAQPGRPPATGPAVSGQAERQEPGANAEAGFDALAARWTR